MHILQVDCLDGKTFRVGEDGIEKFIEIKNHEGNIVCYDALVDGGANRLRIVMAVRVYGMADSEDIE